MTSSADSRELFTCTMRLSFRGGSSVAVPTISFSSKEDAESFNKERIGLIQAISQGVSQINGPTGPIQMPLMQILAELGVMQVGLGIEVGELRNSNLVVPKPKIVLAH